MRREQQRRATSAGGAGGFGSGGPGSYLGGGITGYSPVPRFEPPAASISRTPSRNASPATATPKFKGTGMKLGSKKTTQAALLDALGGEALVSEDMSAPGTPAPGGAGTPEPQATANERGSLPDVAQERYDALLSSKDAQVREKLTIFFLVYSCLFV